MKGIEDKIYAVYIMSDKGNNVLYTGMTGDLPKRVFEHKNHLVRGFTSRYHAIKLVYYETAENPASAIEREKQIKGWTRAKKDALINKMNPQRNDLFDTIV